MHPSEDKNTGHAKNPDNADKPGASKKKGMLGKVADAVRGHVVAAALGLTTGKELQDPTADKVVQHPKERIGNLIARLVEAGEDPRNILITFKHGDSMTAFEWAKKCAKDPTWRTVTTEDAHLSVVNG